MNKYRFVVDTNVLVSSIAFPNKLPSQALRKAISEGVLIFSQDTIAEFKDVLLRPKFDRYIGKRLREAFLVEIVTSALLVNSSLCKVTCRDPKDHKFLDVVDSGDVDLLVSGDKDLLVLEKIGRCSIVSPAEFLQLSLKENTQR
jgi:putative PIN family toxin of toxin-antitoxin system